MKLYQIAIFALLIVFSHSDTCLADPALGSSLPSKPGDCKLTKVSGDEIEKCCYETADNYDKVNSNNPLKGNCVGLNKKQLDNLKTYIKYQEIQLGYDKMKIDCNSSYIKLSLISLLLFFI